MACWVDRGIQIDIGKGRMSETDTAPRTILRMLLGWINGGWERCSNQ